MLKPGTEAADHPDVHRRWQPFRARRERAASLLAILVLSLPLTSPPSRTSVESNLRTSALPVAVAVDQLVIDGHGNGHGIGLSQWGAYGYAVDLGWSSAQILDHYYGATVAASVTAAEAAAPVRVRLMRLDDQQTAVVHDRAQIVVDGVAGGPWGSVVARETSPGAYTVWANAVAVCPASADLVLAGWTAVASALPTVVMRTVTDTSARADPADLLAVCEPTGKVRSYRGSVRAVNGTDGENRTVNEVPLEQYLRPIVASEMSASWASNGNGRGAQALQAQAVAARSYGLAEHRYSYAATCDLTCQTYPGAAVRATLGAAYSRVEQSAVDVAVAATAGVVRRVGDVAGPVAYTMFSASSGGWTASSALPFPAVIDDGDATAANPAHDWTVTVPATTIAAAWPSIGIPTGLTVTSRSGQGEWGGRVLTAVINGTLDDVSVTGDQVRRAFGLSSTWFAIRGSVDSPATAPVDSGSTPSTPSTPSSPVPMPGTVPAAPTSRCGGREAPPVLGPGEPSSPARFASIDPVRLVDTRDGIGASAAPLGLNCTLVVRPPVGEDSTAVAVNITTVNSVANGFVTAYPCGVTRPFTATVQPLMGAIVGGTALVPLGDDGTFCVFSNVTTEVVVDLFGVYSPDAVGRFQPIDAQRRYDSRAAGKRLAGGAVIAVSMRGSGSGGSDLGAVAVTVHLTDAPVGGFVTAWPCGAPRPFVSAANVAAGGAVANHLEVAVGADGQVCFSVSQPMHLTVDLSGWFGPSATTDFHAVTPFRLADTREQFGWPGPAAQDAVRPISVAGAGGMPGAGVVRAIAGQVTAVDAQGPGFVTVDACRPPSTRLSMLRFPAERNVAALVTGITTGDGRWCVTASAATQIVIDVTGWFG